MSNSTKLTIGTAIAATNLRNTVTETITGDTNTVIQNIVGNDITSTLSITGSTNEVYKDLLSSNGSSNVTINQGNLNLLNIQQQDGGTHTLVASINGDSNSITTQQQGSNNTTFGIVVDGSHNTITVRSSNTAIATPLTAVAR